MSFGNILIFSEKGAFMAHLKPAKVIPGGNLKIGSFLCMLKIERLTAATFFPTHFCELKSLVYPISCCQPELITKSETEKQKNSIGIIRKIWLRAMNLSGLSAYHFYKTT
jgi:hypothetical protein